MSGEGINNIELLVGEEFLQLSNTNNGNCDNFSIDLIIPGNWHFVKGFVELLKFLNNKLMCKDVPLIIGPKFVHCFHKVVRIVSFYHVFNFDRHVLLDKLLYVLSDLLVNQCLLVYCRFRNSYRKVVKWTELINFYSRKVLWLKFTPYFPSTNIANS